MSVFLPSYIDRASSAVFEHSEAMDYLLSRGLTEEEIRRYRIGYHPTASPKDDGSKDYADMKKKSRDWLSVRGKIIFPVTACNGVPMGIIARRLDKIGADVNTKIPRYKHLMLGTSSQFGVFFGIEQAASSIVEAGFAYVVEGTVDCISLAKVFPNTVSTLTSMVNSQQMWTLSMLGDCAVVAYDPDKAGKDGAEKALQAYGSKRIVIRELGYGDPNKCLVDMGLNNFSQYAKSRLRYIHFKRG